MICGDCEQNKGFRPFLMFGCCGKVKQCGRRCCDLHLEVNINQYDMPEQVYCKHTDGTTAPCKKLFYTELAKFFGLLFALAGIVVIILAAAGVFKPKA